MQTYRSADAPVFVKQFHYLNEYGTLPETFTPHYYAHDESRNLHVVYTPDFEVKQRTPPRQDDFKLEFFNLTPGEAHRLQFQIPSTVDGHDDKWVLDTLAHYLPPNPWLKEDTILHTLFDVISDHQAFQGIPNNPDHQLPDKWYRRSILPFTTLKPYFIHRYFDTGNVTEYDDLATPMTEDEKQEIREKVVEKAEQMLLMAKLVAHLNLMSRVVEVRDTLGKGEGTYSAIHMHCLTDKARNDSEPYPVSPDMKTITNEHAAQIIAIMQGGTYEIVKPSCRNLLEDVVLGKCHYHWWTWYNDEFPYQ